MSLRLLLVGAVGLMGWDAPEKIDPAAIFAAGRVWAECRLDEVQARLATHREQVEAQAKVESALADDLNFATLMDDMARDFAESQEAIEPPAPVVEPPPAESLALELPENLWAEGTSLTQVSMEIPTEPPTEDHRLTAALKLTGQAMRAWMEVLVAEPSQVMAAAPR